VLASQQARGGGVAHVRQLDERLGRSREVQPAQVAALHEPGAVGEQRAANATSAPAIT